MITGDRDDTVKIAVTLGTATGDRRRTERASCEVRAWLEYQSSIND